MENFSAVSPGTGWPPQVSTVKSCGTPSLFDSRVIPGRVWALGVLMVSTSG